MVVVSGATAAVGVVDCSVGRIVWVQRRNGTWWPGKVLGPDELSTSHIMSPRSGTPVKLLGRENASVDWYNLEKSKRVKSFRCGDFDECIERAKATEGLPSKKREKDARREDAILHALELEKQARERLEQECGNQISERHAEKGVRDVLLRVETGREESQVSGGDDSPGALPRMRGLQDFGLLTVPPPREEFSGVAFRSKRSRYAYLHYDSEESSHDSRDQPSRLQTTVSKFDRSIYPVNVGGDHISPSTEDTESDCSETDSLESDSDDDMMELSDGSLSIELLPKYPRRIETFKEHGSMSSTDDVDGFTSADDASHPFPCDPVSTDMLVDVDLKVKTNNYRRDVPMISLTSKFNGHSIIGDPIEIEALENGSTDKLLKAAGYFSRDLLESPTALRPVWRTGRRTANSRVPQPRFVDESKKLGLSRNSVKNTSPSSNQKIRTLSSIPLEQKHHDNLASDTIKAQVDGLIKTVPTAIACIPVKLVFSRLHEVLAVCHQ